MFKKDALLEVPTSVKPESQTHKTTTNCSARMVEGTIDQIDPASQVDKNSFVFPLQPTSRLLLHTKEVSFQGGEQEVTS